MSIALAYLPDDAQALKDMIASQQIEFLKSREPIDCFSEMIGLPRNEIFVHISETRKWPDQPHLLFCTPPEFPPRSHDYG